jgi:hypothetical protein
VIALLLAWFSVRRSNAGSFEVDQLEDCATFNSSHFRVGTTQIFPPVTLRLAARRGFVVAFNIPILPY